MTESHLRECEPFLRAIAERPGDALPRLILADWLEERGLDREAASAALDQFQQGRSRTASQHHFPGLLTDALARRGGVEVGALYDPPGDSIASGGPEDLFSEKDVDDVVAGLRRIRSTAVRPFPRSAARDTVA